MALPLPKGRNIQVTYRKLKESKGMTSLEASSDHYSLMFVINGDRMFLTPDMSYVLHAGDIHALEPLLYHRGVPASKEVYENILIKFSPNYIKSFNERLGLNIVEEIFKKPPKHFSEDIRDILFKMAESMYQIFENRKFDKNYKEFKLQNMLYTMLLIIYENENQGGEVQIYENRLTQPIMDSLIYMEEHFNSDIKMDKVAEIAGYSEAYFSRLFEEQLGVAFSTYLCNIRLKNVQTELISTSKSITQIALDNGFAYPGNMTASFKRKFGITPMQYKKMGYKQQVNI